MKKNIRDLDLKAKKVLLRVDFNVPIKNGVITDDNRIVEALETIKYVIKAGGKVILFSHLGRVETAEDKAKKSLEIVSKRLAELLKQDVLFVAETRGDVLEASIASMNDGDVLMFENTRFEDVEGKKESKNNPELGKYWASLGDVFINDAFGTAHRAHASNVGIASNIAESAVGFLIEKELKYIGQAIDNPNRPFVSIIGGAKVSDKINVIESLLKKSDKVIIGGGMTYTFLKAQGYNIGKSLCELDKLDLAKSLLEKAGDKILLPVDHVCVKEFNNDAVSTIRPITEIQDDEMGLDVGPKTIETFKNILSTSKTVLWNGPMGVFEMSNFAKGTVGLCEVLANLDAITIIGGGDSAAAAIQNGFADKFTHISTGGGASLEYLEGNILPGIDAIQNK